MFRNRGEVRKSIFVIGIILLFAVFVIGATPLSVPFTSQVPPGTWQETKNCGQTSALMVFCYYNSTIPDEQGIKSIDDWLYIKYGDPINNYNGSDADTTKIEALAKEYGGFPNSYKATSWDITRLKQEIDNGHPIIVAIIASYLSNRGYAWAGGHFVVVKGYDEGDIICNDPGTGSGESKYYLNEEFANALAAQNGSVVVVQPSIACDGGPVEPSNPYELVFNTSGAVATHADQEIPAYTCMIHGDSWTTVTIGFLSSDGVAVFDFPCGFNYDSRYDIIVVPDVRPEWVGIYTPTPLAIHVTGDFYFDGRVQIAGDDIDTNTQDLTYARSGGFPGPKHNQEPSVFVNPPQPPLADYWTKYIFPENSPTRFGVYTSGSEHDIYVPTALAQSTFGPGVPVNPPYKGGGGGGAGGVGGDSGRGYWSGVFSGGP
ncbi:MAG: C39 family peptidase, partial [Sedimentisphaerales bacterium]